MLQQPRSNDGFGGLDRCRLHFDAANRQLTMSGEPFCVDELPPCRVQDQQKPMVKYFDPQLINGPFDDPGLFIDLVFERRALLFDLGDISKLPARKLMRVAHVFITHRHMDHFIGFDHLLRCLLGRDKTVDFWGPPGLIDAVENRIKAYDWNLVDGYEGNLQLRVWELSTEGILSSAGFCGANRFLREDHETKSCQDGVLVTDPGFTVRTAFLDHGIPVLGFALEERARINIWRSRVEEMGLRVGPWLNAFKDAILRGQGDKTPISVFWENPDLAHARTLPLGQLKSKIMKVTKGRKIAYVVDVAFTRVNAEAIVALARDADILFIEAPFLDEDAGQAKARNHLTARQAGVLARCAKAKQLRSFHYSPRYRGREREIIKEAEAAFGEAEAVANLPTR
jgi:ribonuclease Z